MDYTAKMMCDSLKKLQDLNFKNKIFLTPSQFHEFMKQYGDNVELKDGMNVCGEYQLIIVH